MHIITDRAQINRIALIDQERLIAAGKNMAAQAMPAIEAHGVAPEQPFHSRYQVGARRFHDEVEMITHQTVGMHLPRRALTSASEQDKEILPISVIPKDVLAPITAAQEMIDGALVFNSELAWHAPSLSTPAQQLNEKVQKVRTDPFLSPVLLVLSDVILGVY